MVHLMFGHLFFMNFDTGTGVSEGNSGSNSDRGIRMISRKEFPELLRFFFFFFLLRGSGA